MWPFKKSPPKRTVAEVMTALLAEDPDFNFHFNMSLADWLPDPSYRIVIHRVSQGLKTPRPDLLVSTSMYQPVHLVYQNFLSHQKVLAEREKEKAEQRPKIEDAPPNERKILL